MDRRAHEDVKRCKQQVGVAPAEVDPAATGNGRNTVPVRPEIKVSPVMARRALGPTTWTRPGMAALLNIIGMAKPNKIQPNM